MFPYLTAAAVGLCTDDSGFAPTVFVDTYYVPAYDNMTCWCTLDIEKRTTQSVDIKVTRIRAYDNNIDIFINNNKVLVSSDLKTFRYSPNMAIKFEMTHSKYKEQCYMFETGKLRGN